MSDIFNSSPGSAVMVQGQNVVPGQVALSGFNPTAALISHVEYNANTNQQFQYALDSSVYIYVFGDLMGTVVVEGISLLAMCDGSPAGLGEILTYYGENKVSKNTDPVSVNVGDKTITGFLTGLKIRSTSTAQEQEAPLHNWALAIATLPVN